MPDLLLEIGVEEVPAGFMLPALEAMQKAAGKLLAENYITCGEILSTGTPRRLVLIARDVKEVQDLRSREIMGPARGAAFDPSGKPTKAGEGFARGLGVPVESLAIKNTPKGEYVVALRQEGGRATKEVLSEILPAFIASISFPKSMRWGSGTVRFARPIRWILAVLGGEVVPIEFAGLTSGNVSYGHRSMSPDGFSVSDPGSYFGLAREAKVIVDHRERLGMIMEGLEKEAGKQNAKLLEDPDLLEVVNFLVEYPVVTCGHFNEEYLKLPPEVLITSMRSHQKYFSLVDERGYLKPLFLTVNNIRAKDMEIVRRGNERVLSARLADAQFFYNEDLKEPLERKVEKLKKVVYQEKLGTSYEKVQRFVRLAVYLSRRCGLGDERAVERAALLSKADLVSEMVGEFPDLQGVMGKYYAIEAGETEDVSQAIYEHYLPRFAGDHIPGNGIGIVVSLADKMDTIAGSFSIGQRPTGSEDPYGLRRMTIGIIAIVLQKQLEINLPDLIDRALDELKDKGDQDPDQVKADIMEFFRGRLHNLFVQEGYRYDLVEAVLTSGLNNLVDTRTRLEALSSFCERDEFEPLAVAFKRVVNIIPPGFSSTVSEELLAEEEEKALYEIYRKKENGIIDLKSQRKYHDVLMELSSIRPAVDTFFDKVMVMVEDKALCYNRLALMSNLVGLFAEVADFSKIVT